MSSARIFRISSGKIISQRPIDHGQHSGARLEPFKAVAIGGKVSVYPRFNALRPICDRKNRERFRVSRLKLIKARREAVGITNLDRAIVARLNEIDGHAAARLRSSIITDSASLSAFTAVTVAPFFPRLQREGVVAWTFALAQIATIGMPCCLARS